MIRLKGSLMIIATILIAVQCSEDEGDIPSNDFFLALENVNIDFQSIQVVHDPKEQLLFFYDHKFKKGITFNYITRARATRGEIRINEQGYADMGYAYHNGNPEVYVPDSFRVDVYSMRDLDKILSINTGHWVSGISVFDKVISVGYCDRSIQTFDRTYGQPITESSYGHLCEKIESGVYKDTLHVLGFSSGVNAFILDKYTKEGAYINSKSITTELIRSPFIRSSAKGNYFLTSANGHIFSFNGTYLGELSPGNLWRDFAISPSGEIIYALLSSGAIKRFAYPDFKEIGQPFLDENKEKQIPTRIFADDENFVRVYQEYSGGGTNSLIHLSVTPLSELEN